MTEQLLSARYRLRRQLGRGGMAEVWLAHDQELDREVAIKFHTAADDRARFEREARAIAALAHENIAAVYDYGETERGQYLVLEYLPGGSLAERLRGGQPLPDKATWTIARQLAAALAHAHRRGIVHRDLKPSNVLFDVEGRAKLADFGIARAAGQSTLTDPGSILGTAAYLSPEVAAGEPAGRTTARTLRLPSPVLPARPSRKIRRNARLTAWLCSPTWTRGTSGPLLSTTRRQLSSNDRSSPLGRVVDFSHCSPSSSFSPSRARGLPSLWPGATPPRRPK